jgi:hypothetical protein
MSIARGGLGAAKGGDNRIYAIGGVKGNFTSDIVNSVEAYDVGLNTWRGTVPMSAARYRLAAVTGGDNRIYAIGGSIGFSDLNTVEAYSDSFSGVCR